MNFWIRVVFRIVIYSGMFPSWRHLLTEPGCRGWMWIFKTRIYRCHHSRAFSNFVFSGVLLFVSLGSPQGLWVLQMLSPSYLSFSHSHYILSFSIFCSKIVLLLLPPVADLSLYTLYQPVGGIFFGYFKMSSFDCIVWTCQGTFWVFLFFANIFWFISSICIVRLVCGCFFPLGSWMFHFP